MFPASRSTTIAPVFTIDAVSNFGVIPNIALSNASATWPTANKILYIPFRLSEPITVQQLLLHNGAAVSGNVEMAIYSEDGTRIVTSGSTAQAGTTAIQLLNITDTLLGRGAFYFGVSLNNVTGELNRVAPVLGLCQMIGLLTETPGSFGLPAIATFSAYVDAYLPLCGLLAQSTA